MSAHLAEELGVPASIYQRMVALRRDLHQRPELSGQEADTAERIAAQLAALGLSCRRGVGGHGLVAEIPGAEPGLAVALRADMDALPVQEETGLPFSSLNPGVMHACGHDGHSSMLLGAAALLLAGPPPPRPVRLLWQPAEEKAQGAAAMIADGAIDGVGVIFGGHVDRRYPAGALIVTDGPVNASTDLFYVQIQGSGGHGARPHEAVDAVVVGSLLVTALQTIVSREVDPAHPSVVSVGRFEAGTAPNVIAASATLEGTIRAQEPAVRDHLIRSLTRIATAIGQLHSVNITLRTERGTPALFNRPGITALARDAAVEAVGRARVTRLKTANMGGEDFAYFLEKIPGCYIRFGSQIPGLEGHPAHSSRFDIDESALAAGAAWMATVARRAGAALAAGARLEDPPEEE